MVQLSSGTCAVLLHTAAMRFMLPPAARAFLASPDIKLVGFSWAGSDELKFQSSFRMGRANFGSFWDLQVRSCDHHHHHQLTLPAQASQCTWDACVVCVCVPQCGWGWAMHKQTLQQ
jgi:hypothetical protein